MQTDEDGFTLLEVMVAVSILAIILTAVYRLHAQTISMGSAARFYTTAPLLAQQKFAEIGITIKADSISGSGGFGDDFPGYTWHMGSEDVESELLGETAENLKQITLTVSLNDGEYMYSFRTYRMLADEK